VKLAALQVLSRDELRQIHEASVHILQHAGVRIHSRALLEALHGCGLAVDTERGIVRFSRECIETAVSHAPAEFDVFDRDGQPVFCLGDGQPRIAAGHNAVFWVDSESGATRPSRVEDVEQFARLCEHLEAIDVLGVPVMPQDVATPTATLLYAVRACITNSRKPIFFSTNDPGINRACIEMLRAAFAGDLDEQAYGISQLSPTSPLYWEESVCEAVLDTLRGNVPLAILPEPNAGVSAPYTLAGLLTMNNAECLSGLAMIQLLKPGHRVLYANSWTMTDMRTGAALVGSTETSLCRIAGAQLARFYGVPCHTTAPNSDNHAHDEQNAWEKTFGQFCSVAAGNDLIVNCGMFATGMTCSHEQLIMDEEISAMCLRLAAGVRVSEETIAQDLIESIGPQGDSYLTTEHTLRWLRSDEYLPPRVSVRGPFENWRRAGSPDTYQLARARAAALAAKPVPPLDTARQARLAEILREHGAVL
jgi:trimethylamine--corrinoid protein Co-methyltransferase